jgi:F-type H+-transporting ATPase subunit delta
MNAIVTSSETLSKDQKTTVENLIQDKFGKIEVNYTIDPEVFGGIRIEVGDWIFDGTVAKELNQLVNALKA